MKESANVKIFYISTIMKYTAPFWLNGMLKVNISKSRLECITVFIQSIDYGKCGKPMREALIKVNNAVIRGRGRS